MQKVFINCLWVLVALLEVNVSYSLSKRYYLLEATENEGEKYRNYRLPNDTYPEQYNIKITTNVHSGERSFKGEVIIDICVLIDTDDIVLHSLELDINKVTINQLCCNDEPEELSKAYDLKRNFLILTRKTGQRFISGSKHQITIQYNGSLRSDKRGFYMTKYKDDNGNDRYVATTQFESTNARSAFPCYDEPAIRTNFTITIDHSPTYKAVSNMPVNESFSSANQTVFETTDRIPTYLVAFVVSDFEFTKGIFSGIKHRLYSRSSAMGEHDWSLVSGMLMVKHLSQYFGIDFMLPKIDYVAIPELASAGVENYGLIIIPEGNLLFNKTTSNVVSQSNAVRVVAHEISHQWFGGYVTIQWWSYLWLKEGFATLFSYKVLENIFPEWSVWQGFHTFEYQNALKNDASTGRQAMTTYVETPEDIAQVYGALGSVPYAKAACILHMWNNALTERVFQKALFTFLRNNQYKAVTEEELLHSFESAVKELRHKLPASINEMMLSWIHQSGYPLLTVTRNYANGSFTVKQEAFYNEKTINSDKTWYVPINYAFASEPDYRNTEASHYLLNVRETTITAQIRETDWLLLNKQSFGYYRINYDEKNWKLIIKSLIDRPSKFHVRNRAQLMHDAYRFSTSSRLDHGTLLNLLTYLKQEDQYAPWSTAYTILHTYDHYLAQHENYNDFQYFLAQLVGPIFRKLGVDEVPGEHYYNKKTRSIILDLACGVGLKECLRDTNYKIRKYVNDNTPIELNLLNSVYCNGLRQSSDEIFDSIYENLMDSSDQNLRRILIAALGCSQNEKQIKKYIYSSLDESNNLTHAERFKLLYPAYSHSEVGLTACIEFLDKHWIAYGNLSRTIGTSNSLDIEMRYMASYITSEKHRKMYSALLSKVIKHHRVSSSLKPTALKTISNNLKWIRVHGEPIMKWVKKYRYSKKPCV